MILFIGGLIGGALGAAGAVATAKLQMKEAKRQRAWQEKMRSTAYQATMGDMRSAGLNPILAYRQGPTAAGQGAVAHIPNFGAAMAQGASAGAGAALSGAQRQSVGKKRGLEMAVLRAQEQAALSQESSARGVAHNQEAQAAQNIYDLQHIAPIRKAQEATRLKHMQAGLPKAQVGQKLWEFGGVPLGVLSGARSLFPAGRMWKQGLRTIMMRQVKKGKY